MKKIRLTLTILLIIILTFHAGCMNSDKPAPGGLSGLVTDSAGKPLSAVKVASTEASTVTDIYGKWALESLVPQVTQLTASRENYQPQTRNIEVISGEVVTDINFSLPADTEIYNILVSGITSSRARITFYSKFSARASIKYGSNALMDKSTSEDAELLYTHQYDLEGLSPATTYQFKCVATDKTGRTLESEIQTFNTPVTARGESPTGLLLSKATNSNMIVLQWNSDSGTDFAGFLIYRSTSALGPFSRLGSGVVKQNTWSDIDVKPGVKYYYRVTRTSGSGDESSPSNVASLLMPGVISENVVWNLQESPYQLTGDLTVAANASLIVNKGVSVSVAGADQWDADSGSDRIDILVQGTLMVQGTALSPVTITSAAASPQPGDWNGITFDNSADLNASYIKGLSVSFAENGINGLAGLPETRDSGFYSCRQAAVKSTAARRDLLFSKLTVETCANGFDLQKNPVKVQILDCAIKRCITGIICLNNQLVEIERNKVILAGACGMELGNIAPASKTRYNIIGYGSSGTGIICRGNDEVRRNTVQAGIGFDIRESAKAVIRSNLVLADAARNGVGIMYSGSIPYNPSTATNHFVNQNNALWNAGAARKYVNADGSALTGFSSDLAFPDLAGPGLQGGDPFASLTNQNFNYKPSSGSPLKGAGYDYETVGAEDVPD